MSSKAQLDGFIAKFTPEIGALTRQILARMRARLPGAMEMVYDNYNALAIGFGPTERASEAVFSIVVFPRWVSLFFLQGATLPDPAKILKGAGNVVRHVVLKDAGDLDKPAIRVLMAQALKRIPIDPTGTSQLIVKSVSEKQRPRRPVSSRRRP